MVGDGRELSISRWRRMMRVRVSERRALTGKPVKLCDERLCHIKGARSLTVRRTGGYEHKGETIWHVVSQLSRSIVQNGTKNEKNRSHAVRSASAASYRAAFDGLWKVCAGTVYTGTLEAFASWASSAGTLSSPSGILTFGRPGRRVSDLPG